MIALLPMQFKVLRDGYWSRVDFRKDEDAGEKKEEVKLNPWIQRYSNTKVQASRKSRASCAKARFESTENQESIDKNAGLFSIQNGSQGIKLISRMALSNTWVHQSQLTTGAQLISFNENNSYCSVISQLMVIN